MPCGHAMGGRNLIVCIDGTSNQFGDKNTNVIELYNLILKEDINNQKSWYSSGIGTYAKPSQKSLKYYKKALWHKIDLAFALNFGETLQEAYRWLSNRYEDGDCIFLFGFSRGAFQVRALSAMIEKVGLICRGNETQIPFAYEVYINEDDAIMPMVWESDPRRTTTKAENFKSIFSRQYVRVHFVGAWDSVSSIGIARPAQMLPGTIEGMKHVCYFRHALALDERRVKFLPEYAWGGTTFPPGSENDTQATGSVNTYSRKRRDIPVQPHTKEVWFAGTHSDIGGGNSQNAGMDRSRPPLRWMVFEAGTVGLRTNPFKDKIPSSKQININESLKGIWWPLELLPLKRLTFTRRQDGKQTTRKPHFGSGRKIQPGQKIHTSLLLAKGADEYIPVARPPPDVTWDWTKVRKEDAINQPELRGWLEFDLYEYTKTAVGALITDGEGSLEGLRQIAVSADGQQAVYDAVIDNLNSVEVDHESQTEDVKEASCTKQTRLLHATLQIVETPSDGGTQLELSKSSEVFPWVSSLWDSEKDEYREVVRDFILQLTNPCLHALEEHKSIVSSVAFSPDGRRIASSSWDRTICIWDAATGTILKGPFEGHTGPVNSVAFSPDGKCIISGSFDATIRVWDAETGKTVVGPIKGHTGDVNSVAFSPDGSRVVSGSDDETVRIWDTETGKPVGEPLWGYTRIVFSVAFSLDGKRVVSGSSDCMVRIWDAETGNAVREPLQGHTDWVRSVAFSPDGTRIISGSDDGTIRIWDATTGETVVGPIRGHTSSVLSATYSPDGQYVVSGSGDETVRIWDAEMGKQVGEPLRGHTGWVYSVAFSPDGKCIASGSWDETVRIWDVETWVKVARLDSVEKATI
ncbi:hypothetical protein NLJ89_g6019 [Agrocybe chaxingu]|uniref:T6SS Phospholipase effector Tle1-like catalytic domain-containing protein n=1 Tax=Agrocybe chaxingu TaxID=84603 RepID=A0A9W8K799_9AGAR|nr:hypothetical protein NLJ89_g6019 [Agrocybe chaxingu]